MTVQLGKGKFILAGLSLTSLALPLHCSPQCGCVYTGAVTMRLYDGVNTVKRKLLQFFFFNFSFAIQSHLRCGLRVNLCVEILALAVAALTEPLQPKGIGARGREQ